MIGLIRKLLDRGSIDLPTIPDDVGVEDRYSNVAWSSNPSLRRAQRRCFLIAEFYRAHPEIEAPIIEQNRRYYKIGKVQDPGLAEYAGVKLAGEQPPRKAKRILTSDDGWEGIESTAPPNVRRQLEAGTQR